MAGPGGEETYIHMRPASTVENSSFFPNGEEPSSPGQVRNTIYIYIFIG